MWSPVRLFPLCSDFDFLLTVYSAELLNLHRGQGLELLWRDSLQCPTEEEYVKMVNNSKSWSYHFLLLFLMDYEETGGVFRIAVKLMMAYATTNTDM